MSSSSLVTFPDLYCLLVDSCPTYSNVPTSFLRKFFQPSVNVSIHSASLVHAVRLNKFDIILILLHSPRLMLLQSLYYSHSVRGVLSLYLELHERKSGETIMSLWVLHYLSQGNECFLIILYCSLEWNLGFIFIDTFIIDLQASWQISTVMFNNEKQITLPPHFLSSVIYYHLLV